MAEHLKFAYYIAGMDLNIDLIQAAVDCLRKRAGAKAMIYVGIEEADIEIESATVIRTPKGKQWTGRVRDHLAQIKHDYLVVLLEDYFVHSVDEKSIGELVELAPSFEAGVIKLLPAPRPSSGIPGCANIGFYEDHLLGRVNTQPALWKKDYLLSLLFRDESLWQFEINSAIRSIVSDKNVLGLYHPVLRYDEVVKRGKFRRRYKNRYNTELEKYAISTNRGYLKVSAEIFFEISHAFSQILKLFTTQHFRSSLKSLVRRVK